MPILTKINFLFPLVFGLILLQSTQTGGLKFNGSEHAINQRTSYDVFGNNQVEFSDHFEIDFNLSLSPATEIGYILRIKNKENDRIFNLFYDGQGDQLIFKFNESNLIEANLDRDQLLNKQWFDVKIAFGLAQDSIILSIDNETYSAENLRLSSSYSPVILFGKSDHIIDVPSFAIKDLSVSGKDTYRFPLLEDKGTVVHDISGKPYGQVDNPDWLKNYAYHWKHQVSFKSQAIAGANYNPKKKEIYYYNEDSIWTYNVRSGLTELKVFEEKSPIELILGTNFIDTVSNKLYSYEVYYETPNSKPTVASLDLDSYEWNEESYEQLPTQLHHHGSYLNQTDSTYTIFGGFGNMKYSKSFFTFDLNQKTWTLEEEFAGDVISPRYFSSVGYQPEQNKLYILGGMGNESGEQSVGRKYYYDLHQVDLNNNRITKLWEVPWENDNVVPVRGMVLLNDSSLYTLCYPEHFSESSLRLYRFSIKDGSYEILGDSIPIRSDKITTNANLYFDKGLNNLYAIVQEFEDDISSDLKVYSLAFPAITKGELSNFPEKQKSEIPFIALIIGAGALVLGFILYKKLRTKSSESIDTADEVEHYTHPLKIEPKSKPNSILLFGNFTVRDSKNRDITYMFSTQLKQVFCLILQYSITEDGISSQHLSHLLWPDRPADKVKNSRGVTINNLRKTLSELEGLELIHEKGHYKLIFHEEAYCDYVRFLQIITSHEINEHRDEFTQIVSKGKFLYLSDDPIFDSFKEDAETKLEPVLLLEIEKNYAIESYQNTISLSEALFHIDPLNETALVYQIKAMQKLKMQEESIIAFRTFAIEYKRVTGKEFHRTYASLSS